MENEILDPEDVNELDDNFLDMKLVEVGGIPIWTYVGVEPDHYYSRSEEVEE